MTEADIAPSNISRRFRWWHITIAAVVVLVAGAVTWLEVVRSNGRAHYERVNAEIVAAGRPGTIEDYVGHLPKVDAGLQQDWITLQQRLTYGEHAEPFDYPKIDAQEWSAWVGGEHLEPPAGARAELAKSQEVMRELFTLVRRGPLTLGLQGWAAQDFAPGRDNSFASACQHLGNLLILRNMGEWLRHHALLVDSADADLADFDRLIVALSHPGSEIDALIALPLCGMRDQCYVELAVQKRLPKGRKDRWLSETPDAYDLVADGLRGERILFNGSVVNVLSKSLVQFVDESRKWPGEPMSIHRWIFGIDEAATQAEMYDRVELLVRNGTPLPASIRDAVRAGNTNENYMLNQVPVIAMKAEASHRIARLGVRIIDMARGGGGLPSTEVELGQRLGDPRLLDRDGRHLGLTYQLLAKDRFRLTADPESAPPDFADPTREIWKTDVNIVRNAIHAPASKQPIVYAGFLIFEARVPSE